MSSKDPKFQDNSQPPRTRDGRKKPHPQQQQQQQHHIVVVGGGASGIFAAIAAAERISSQQQHQQQRDNNTHKIQVTVLEATSKTLTKVKISGGGRCNVMHDTSLTTATILSKGYPRGQKELTGIFHKQFTPRDAQGWFQQHGVTLKTESDGRMFPITDSSQTVMDALLTAAEKSGVSIQKQSKVMAIEALTEDSTTHVSENHENKFRICLSPPKTSSQTSTTTDESTAALSAAAAWNAERNVIVADAVILATGSAVAGYQMAAALGHDLVKPVPSLFTLNCKLDVKQGDIMTKEPDGLLYGLSGVSVPHAKLSFLLPDIVADGPKVPTNADTVEGGSSTTTTTTAAKTKTTAVSTKKKKAQILTQEGPLLITHHGLSGPAALRLSAFGARDFAAAAYKGELRVHWAPDCAPGKNQEEAIFNELWKMTTLYPKRAVSTSCPLFLPNARGTPDNDNGDSTTTTTTAIPRRLWFNLVTIGAGIPADLTWGQASKKFIRQLAVQICDCPLTMTGKGTFKEEFVTAGGIALNKSVDMKSMQSTIHPGLYFCGEVINVDGVTGGFNFMNCWSTGFVAGTSAAENLLHKLSR